MKLLSIFFRMEMFVLAGALMDSFLSGTIMRSLLYLLLSVFDLLEMLFMDGLLLQIGVIAQILLNRDMMLGF